MEANEFSRSLLWENLLLLIHVIKALSICFSLSDFHVCTFGQTRREGIAINPGLAG